MSRPVQTPGPGTRLLRHRGDVLQVALRLAAPLPGRAWLRTNIGRAHVRRRAIIEHVDRNRPILAQDWHDVPMRAEGGGRYGVRLPLLEVGRFEYKAMFQPERGGPLLWPQGANSVVKVEPAAHTAANTIYTAFVRLTGSTRTGPVHAPVSDSVLHELEQAGYTVIPRSGTFRDLVRQLDFILGTLGFRILQLLPIHPTPTTYARMGQLGSPFAALDFLDVDPALAEFDRKTTPMDQFRELVDAVHAHGARLFLDIPVNHTGWASRLQIEHPEWFLRDGDSSFRSPGAWGVTWEDLSQLDYSHHALWRTMADVFLAWCRRGVDGFRCDAGYMVPAPAWEYMVAAVREQHPDTAFLLEGLGGKLSTTRALLGDAGLDWAYSEVFQTHSRHEFERYLPTCIDLSSTAGTLVHFAETHDNNRLAARSKTLARMRTALSALLSHNGAFGITSGVEWFATEKIDVHRLTALNWGSAENQVEWIRRLNAILETHPAFHEGVQPRLVQDRQGECLAVKREPPGSAGDSLLILVNLCDDRTETVSWPLAEFDGVDGEAVDLLTGRARTLRPVGKRAAYRLEPGEVLCLGRNTEAADRIEAALQSPAGIVRRGSRQEARAKTLEIAAFFGADVLRTPEETEAAVDRLLADPVEFCRHCAAREEDSRPAFAPVTAWHWPRDVRRHVVLPPGHCLLIEARHPFAAEMRTGGTTLHSAKSLAGTGGRHFAVVVPGPTDQPLPARLALHVRAYENGACRHAAATLLCPTASNDLAVRTVFDRHTVIRDNLYALATNGIGGMAQVRGAWAQLRSQYDALLAANLHDSWPVDRRVLFTRCRAWLVRDEYSEELGPHCLVSFTGAPGEDTVWRFRVPAGRGRTVRLRVTLSMARERNAVALRFVRDRALTDSTDLEDDIPVRLILRPDIEDRLFHDKTKAFAGPERTWPEAVAAEESSFRFRPADDRFLDVALSRGTFHGEHEWVYNVRHTVEAERGLDDRSDLFSPGYFRSDLRGGEAAVLSAEAGSYPDTRGKPDTGAWAGKRSEPARGEGGHAGFLSAVGRAAIRQFVVKRDSHRTIIAGYPWFLDWGRDTLICLRGIIAAGLPDEARDILTQFACFEREGTLPNMIRGNDDSNRDTSDAPLWFFAACEDLMTVEGDAALLSLDCRGRPLLDVLRSIAESYLRGTPNGIRVDPDSALVFSPAHFTWMDTNHPAGTPREGYPIEIQALWHRALRLLARLEPDAGWAAVADRVHRSVHTLYPVSPSPADGEFSSNPHSALRASQFLSDCLHAAPGTPAAEAVADNALRPNQLLAVTLGLVEDPALRAGILAATEELLVPGAIRSLADRPVRPPLPIEHEGRLLNDPDHPYWGQYLGDEDTRRKPAYHNGTAWTWPFPSYCEALVMTYGLPARETALALLAAVETTLNSGCVGQVPELADGDAPHGQRGCGAQAWGVTELYRVLAILTRNE